MEWLLVVMSMGYHASPAVGDGGYTTEDLCKKAGSEVVTRLNALEVAQQKRHTTVHSTGGTTEAYRAKSWVFECFPVRKR